MTIKIKRGLVAARNDVSVEAANKLLAELNTAFEAFKTEHKAELAAVRKDVVQTEKVDRINAEVGRLSAEVETVNAALAAVKLGPGSGTGKPRDAYSQAFEGWFRKGKGEDALAAMPRNAAIAGSDPAGGYTVPDQMEAGIMDLLRTVSALRSYATVMSIAGPRYKKLVSAQGGTTGWVGETDARTETTAPTLRALEINVMELYANPAATRELLDDSSVSIEAWLANEVAGDFADAEGAAFVSGSGVGRPRGITSYTNIANASYAWGSVGYIASGASAAFATSNPADKLIDMVHALRSGYRANARWLMSDVTAAEVRKLKDGQGNYLWRVGLEQGQPSSILGYPVAIDENMAAIAANSYSIAFADFARAYLIVDRIGVRVLRDELTNKPYIHFYTTKRVGGGIQNFEAIKLMKFAAS